jgi:hypothetical protein
MAYDLLEQTHSGWEDGDGAFGRFVFAFADHSITLEFNERYVDSNVTVAGRAPWRRGLREAIFRARGGCDQERRLYRVGAQNSRMAATSPGIV